MPLREEVHLSPHGRAIEAREVGHVLTMRIASSDRPRRRIRRRCSASSRSRSAPAPSDAPGRRSSRSTGSRCNAGGRSRRDCTTRTDLAVALRRARAVPVVRRIVAAPLLGVVRGQRALAERDPFPHVAEEDRSGDAEPPQHLDDVDALPQAHPGLVPVSLPGRSPGHSVTQRRSTVTTRFTAASGSRIFHPNAISGVANAASADLIWAP